MRCTRQRHCSPVPAFFRVHRRYIDPVRARMTDNPLAFAWSSCGGNCNQQTDKLLTPHPAYIALDPTPATHTAVYYALLNEAIAGLITPVPFFPQLRPNIKCPKKHGMDVYRRRWLYLPRTHELNYLRPLFLRAS